MKTFLAKITISRGSDDSIRIELMDEASGISFFRGHMTAEDFGNAVTGLGRQPVYRSEVCSTENVGKKKIVENRRAECPLDTCDKEKLKEWLRENCQEPGWIIDLYLGSQRSVAHNNGKTILNYSVYKYVIPSKEEL